MYRGQATWAGPERTRHVRERIEETTPLSDGQPTQPRPSFLPVPPMAAIVSLKSDQSPSGLNTTTISAADSSTPPAVLRVGQASTDEVHH
jgi:hypothetical protein